MTRPRADMPARRVHGSRIVRTSALATNDAVAIGSVSVLLTAQRRLRAASGYPLNRNQPTSNWSEPANARDRSLRRDRHGRPKGSRMLSNALECSRMLSKEASRCSAFAGATAIERHRVRRADSSSRGRTIRDPPAAPRQAKSRRLAALYSKFRAPGALLAQPRPA